MTMGIVEQAMIVHRPYHIIVVPRSQPDPLSAAAASSRRSPPSFDRRHSCEASGMSILNRPSDGLLSVLIALRSGLLAYGPQPETELLELVAPTSVVTDGKPDMAKKTLTRWKQLGFFQETRGAVCLGPSISLIAADDTDGLRAAILRLVLAPENNPRLQVGDGEDDEKSMASDCSRALAWILAQDPYSLPLVYADVELLQSRQEVSPRVFANDTRWQGLVEWAVFLGAGFTSTRSGLTLCPAFAVRTFLDEVFQKETELPQAEFFLRLAEFFPLWMAVNTE